MNNTVKFIMCAIVIIFCCFLSYSVGLELGFTIGGFILLGIILIAEWFLIKTIWQQ